MRDILVKLKYICMICLLLSAVSIFDSDTASADELSTVKLKVGFCRLDGFFEYDSNGDECGYGVDYLNEISKFSSIHFDYSYIKVKSWEELPGLLKSGSIDIIMPASEPVKASSELSFTTEDIMTTYHAIMTKKNRGDLYYDDYSSIGRMKIAITKQLLDYVGMKSYLKSINVYKNLVYYNDYNECKQALDDEKVDGVISNVMDLTDDMKILNKFSVSHNYIVMKNTNPYYKNVNKALTELKLAEPTFENALNVKYYPDRINTPLGKYEENYLRKNNTLNVAVYDDYKPISYYDKKSHKYKGIAVDLMDKLGEKLGIKFRYFAINTKDPYDMFNSTKTDIVLPVYVDDLMYYKTKSLFDSDINYITKSSYGTLNDNARIAVVKKYKYISDCLKNKTKYNIVEYDTIEDACNGVNDGEVDAFATSTYNAKFIIQNPRYRKLDIREFNNISLPFGLAINNNSILESALNKGIQYITSEERKIL